MYIIYKESKKKKQINFRFYIYLYNPILLILHYAYKIFMS